MKAKEKDKTYDVYWTGPKTVEELNSLEKNNVLYMICGTHSLYGQNVPLYIGQTKNGVEKRIKEHAWWIDDEQDQVKIYHACIGEFHNWAEWSKVKNKPEKYEKNKLTPAVIDAIEALLIFAHGIVYNSKNRQTIKDTPIMIFNTGHRGILYPEVSSRRWDDY
jgi:hypothetical protein